MELTERVHKLEVGHVDHETRLERVEKENEEQKQNDQTFHDFIIKNDARAEGRDRTLKVFMTVLSVLSILSPVLTIIVTNMVK